MIDFFDTSALLKHYVKEPGTPAIRAAMRARRPAVARITHTELGATFARLCREGAIDEATREALFDRVDQDFPTFEVVEWRATCVHGPFVSGAPTAISRRQPRARAFAS